MSKATIEIDSEMIHALENLIAAHMRFGPVRDALEKELDSAQVQIETAAKTAPRYVKISIARTVSGRTEFPTFRVSVLGDMINLSDNAARAWRGSRRDRKAIEEQIRRIPGLPPVFSIYGEGVQKEIKIRKDEGQ